MKLRTIDPEGFAEFWNCWRPHMRRTDGRIDACDGYRKHILAGAEPADIIDGARAFLRDWSSLPKDEQKFIPLAKTWLNKGSYLDWCEKERDFQRRLSERSNVVQISAGQPRGQTLFLKQFNQSE
jgi:hypothetical protein